MDALIDRWDLFLLEFHDIFKMMWDVTPDLWYFCTHTIAESAVYFEIDDPVFDMFSHMNFTPLEMILGGAMFMCFFTILRKFFSLLGG
jgi:hypothetical protein